MPEMPVWNIFLLSGAVFTILNQHIKSLSIYALCSRSKSYNGSVWSGQRQHLTLHVQSLAKGIVYRRVDVAL